MTYFKDIALENENITTNIFSSMILKNSGMEHIDFLITAISLV